ncbi:pilus assembly protein PilM [Duganella sp. P38]|uniref:pilus assembly protein PilM n=1 Tax=Duganella sp. P38 TaxID=3423949 RepID=UPI003D7A1FE5
MIDLKALLGQGSPPLVGIDISTSSVRLVELAPLGKPGAGYRLERYAAEPLPRNAVTDGNIENIDQVVEAVRRVWKKSGTRARLAALGMPPASVITKKIILPAGMSEDQLEIQVESEASQYLPFALDEVSLDFDVIGPAANAADDIEVMLAAARREKVEDRVAIAEASGLKATVMDIESYAARAALERVIGQMPHAGAGQVIALFQIGAHVTHLSVMLDGATVYEREQPFGGNTLTQDIVRSYGLSFDEAEARKKTGDLPGDYHAELLTPFLESAALEVTRAIQFFYTSTPYTRVDQLYLAGGCALMPGLLDLVASRTRIAGAVAAPFQGMQLASSVRAAQLRLDAPAYLVACGLALRRFG